MINEIFIDSSNYKHLVWREFEGYSLSLSIAHARETKKGYLGMKHKTIVSRLRIKNKDGAEKLWSEWKEEYLSKYLRKEILALYISCSPIYFYKVKCPKCGGEAVIQDFIMCSWIREEDSDFFGCPIACPDCDPNNKNWYRNSVGACAYLDRKDEEKELNLRLKYENTGIKYKDFINNSSILDKKRQ